MELSLSTNQKVEFYKGHLNTFGTLPGLPEQGGTCPGATTGKGGCLSCLKEGGKQATCYMDKELRAFPALKRKLERNTLSVKTDAFESFNRCFRSFSARMRKREDGDKCLRLYFSGDIDGMDTAQALRAAILANPSIRFWGYTRSCFSVGTLANLPNLALYVSADPCNTKLAHITALRHGVPVAWMGNDKPDGFVTCPAVTGKVANCGQCRLCIKGKVDVHFPIH